MDIKKLISSGELNRTIELLADGLRSDPMNIDVRSQYIELLCLDGQLQLADSQLDMLVKQHPECLGGAVNLRQLVRAAQARIDFSKGADSATLLAGDKTQFGALVKMRLGIMNDDKDLITKAKQVLESYKVDKPIAINDTAVLHCRDGDDTFSQFLECFGTNGHYYLLAVDQIEKMSFLPVSSLIENVWRRVQLTVKDGLSGEVFVPLTYVNSETESQKLGRETDWLSLCGGLIYEGVGLKTWLVGEEGMTLQAISSISEAFETDPVEPA
ncbi:type VI secretion system accessory protein TagJ [Corallincola platygyrae]|uniref:Type VI secretion system accessory protein TagJ n=1 Tax=Corallincola platygyrae TaxID=1193278 RepID=A0ABW4XJB7_9GAMM